jgi:hypothetical protein
MRKHTYSNFSDKKRFGCSWIFTPTLVWKLVLKPMLRSEVLDRSNPALMTQLIQNPPVNTKNMNPVLLTPVPNLAPQLQGYFLLVWHCHSLTYLNPTGFTLIGFHICGHWSSEMVLQKAVTGLGKQCDLTQVTWTKKLKPHDSSNKLLM